MVESVSGLPATRSEAKAAGSENYFTGNPCRRGHIQIRRTSNGSCLDCRKDYYQENSDKIKKRARYHEQKMKADPDWIANKRKRNREYAAQKRRDDPEFLALSRKRCRENNRVNRNREKHRIQAKNRRAKIKGADGKFSSYDIGRILELQRHKCAICKCDLNKSGYHVDHIVPIVLGGSNYPQNLQCLCPPCNLSKAAKHPIDFMRERGSLL
jgi:hypothetical protein